ncbi:DUF2795 domain-containing protein [Paraburkholderia phosphatilytica]|uniref:DUF2795 domain-containing protein n=1 Tax=Paraburkholderia phosphatilytica TaxID=2282883 RepID=UPI000E468E69|nr:DUF2795 domain-containing protein [Paraburkholderia phosphatilytica]
MAQHPAHAQNHLHPDKPPPVEIEKALNGGTYPTTRERLVEAARSNRADTEVVAVLNQLPDQHYDSASAVMKEVSRLH